MSIYTGQRIPLETIFTKESDNSVIDITAGSVRYDYWLPGNAAPNPADGFVSGKIVDGPAGSASGNIPAELNTTRGTWTIQAVVTISGDEWAEVSSKFKVLDRGK